MSALTLDLPQPLADRLREAAQAVGQDMSLYSLALLARGMGLAADEDTRMRQDDSAHASPLRLSTEGVTAINAALAETDAHKTKRFDPDAVRRSARELARHAAYPGEHPVVGPSERPHESPWIVDEAQSAEAEREQAFLSVTHLFGPEYAQRWHDGLIAAIQGLRDTPPGPRTWRRVASQELLRQSEVRVRLYGGPAPRPVRAVSYCILCSVLDSPYRGHQGRLLILRLLPADGEEAEGYGITLS